MRRPGFLSGNVIIKPKYSKLGTFGKGYAPPPGPPAPSTPGLPAGSVTDAIDTSTGDFYIQDARCSPGMKMKKTTEPCKPDPGAPPDDCDPGEMETFEECANDPNYKKLPKPPSAGFKNCNEWSAAGYPTTRCNKTTCSSCFASPAPAAAPAAPAPTGGGYTGGGGGGGRRPGGGFTPGTHTGDEGRYAAQQALFTQQQAGPGAPGGPQAGSPMLKIAAIGAFVVIGGIILIKLK